MGAIGSVDCNPSDKRLNEVIQQVNKFNYLVTYGKQRDIISW